MLSGTPCISSVKIYWDALVCTKSSKKGTYIVVKDHTGSVLGCLSAPLAVNTHPLAAEYYALRRAIQLGIELGL